MRSGSCRPSSSRPASWRSSSALWRHSTHTGKKGRLTRVCAILCALFVTVFLWIGVGSGAPGLGAIVVFVGCVIAFIGGLLTER